MISIILIHYNAQDLLIKAIQSVLECGGIDKSQLEFIIIDNSQNFDEEIINDFNLNYIYQNPGYNSGFARAVNCGLKRAKGSHVLLMNQDAWLIEKQTLLNLIKKSNELPEKTVVGCSIQNERGEAMQSVWLDEPGIKREWRFGALHQKFNPTWKETIGKKLKAAHSKNDFVPQIGGAFLLFRKLNAIDEILFDKDFFLYGEDVEWGVRIKKKDWQFYHYADIKVGHIGSASSFNQEQKQKQIIVSDWLAMRKTKGKLYLSLLLSLTLFNKLLDALLLSTTGRVKKVNPEIREYTLYRNRIYFSCLKQFAIPLLIRKNFSTERTFFINLYHDQQD
jgi:GT2 family glycosyltransferase